MRLSGDERRLLFGALALLPLAEMAARFLPLPKLIRLFHLRTTTPVCHPPARAAVGGGKDKPVDEVAYHVTGQTAGPPEHLAAAMAMRKIFRVIERKFYFWPGKCLAQALVARFFLRRRGVSCLLILGAKQSGNQPGNEARPSLRAHAWLKVGDIAVTGDGVLDYIPVAFFI